MARNIKTSWAIANFIATTTLFFFSIFLVHRAYIVEGRKALILMIFAFAFFLSWVVAVNALIQMVRRHKKRVE